MKNFILFILLFLFTLTNESLASIKINILQNLENTENLSFNFEQNINGKIENGNCVIEYPKKIFCKYESNNQKIIVSNGKFLVIKTNQSHYVYPIKKTPLNFILDKKFLINEIKNLDGRIIDNNLINYNFHFDDNEINLFFDKKNYNLVGWQTIDMYQNLSITYLFSVTKNKNLKKNLFKLPKQD